MKQPNFDILFEAAAQQMITSFLKSSSGMRPDEIGIPRENQVKDFLKEWIPEKYGISKGYLIDTSKSVSKECDVVIYDKDSCPKFIFDTNLDIRFFPRSEVYGTLEVKSVLNKKELENSIKKIESVNQIGISTIHDFPFSDEWDEIDIKLAKVGDNKFVGSKTRNTFIDDDQFEDYKAKVKRRRLDFSDSFTGIFAYKLDSKIGFDDLKEIFKSKNISPNFVCILDRGLLVKVNENNLKRLKALQENKSIKDFKQDFDIAMEILNLSISRGGFKHEFVAIESNEKHVNLMNFYSFLMDFLGSFKKYSEFHPADIISIWKKNIEE